MKWRPYFRAPRPMLRRRRRIPSAVRSSRMAALRLLVQATRVPQSSAGACPQPSPMTWLLIVAIVVSSSLQLCLTLTFSRLSATQLAGSSCRRRGCGIAGSCSTALRIFEQHVQTSWTIPTYSACLLATNCMDGIRDGTEMRRTNGGCGFPIGGSFGYHVSQPIMLLPLQACCITEDWSNYSCDAAFDDDMPSLIVAKPAPVPAQTRLHFQMAHYVIKYSTNQYLTKLSISY